MSQAAEVMTWQGQVSDSLWRDRAEAILLAADEWISFSVSGVGNQGQILIQHNGSDLTIKVDAIGKTRGVLKQTGEHSHVFAVVLMGLSKVLPFQMADPKGELVSARFVASNPFLTSLGVPLADIEGLAVKLGLMPNPALTKIERTAAFF